MEKDNFYILHLSDLHIQKESSRKPYYQNSLKKLIEDINKQTKDKTNIIVVVSGDIVDKGNYTKHYDAAISFFTALYERIKERVKDIIIVPGNHDKVRDPIDSMISIVHADCGLGADSRDSIVEWKAHLNAYKDFFDLVNKIYEIFEQKKTIDNSYGVELVQIGNINIGFIRFDSAWCSHAGSKSQKLRIGENQLRDLLADYTEAKNKCESDNLPIALTIGVSHYPLNWLIPDDEELCYKYFLAKKFLDVDVIMCGHVHDFSAINYFNHEHSLLTLVTGIGWNESVPNDEKNENRYSIYSINLAYNSCDIIMRKTKSDGEYDYDYSVYVGEREFKDTKLRYPLRIKENTSFIRINTPTDATSKSLFLNNDIMELIPKVSEIITSFSDAIAGLNYQYKENCFLGFVETFLPGAINNTSNLEEEDKFLYNQVKDYLYKSIELDTETKNKYLNYPSAFLDFLGFLNEICLSAVEEFQECFSDNISIRAHFRWHFHKEEKGKTIADEYCMLCQYDNLPEDVKKADMQNISWGGLIEPSYKTGKPIVFSANRQYNAIETDWNDFITLIPQFSNYTHDIRIKKGTNESRPIITFGISIKGDVTNNDIQILHLLAYLRFDKILARMIDGYIRLFNIDIKTFLTRIHKMKNETSKETNNNE